MTFDDLFPADNPLPSRLSKILEREFDKPEGRVRCEWVSRLATEYGFCFEQIGINIAAGAGRDAERSSVFADIVAYRDKRRKEPFLVVETKRPEEKLESNRSNRIHAILAPIITSGLMGRRHASSELQNI